VAFEIRIPGRPVTGAFDPVTQRLWECLANGCGLSPAAAGTIFSTGRNPPERPAKFPGWFQSGLRVRNARRKVIESEPLCGVLCGDDSNMYTRLPVMLAARRGISTADFHHGAIDGRYLLKELPCDTYLAKNEMEREYLLCVCGLPPERVALGAPAPAPSDSPQNDGPWDLARLVLFSEPYENFGLRAEEVYRELLPPPLPPGSTNWPRHRPEAPSFRESFTAD
jgi:hypothetical protein